MNANHSRCTTRATHWLPAQHPEVAQAVASITLNFGAYESQLSDLLVRLQCCPPNKQTSPKRSVADILKAIRSASVTAFNDSPLANRIASIADEAQPLNERRNILIHGYVLKESKGGLVLISSTPTERVVYDVALSDLVTLDDQISRANQSLECFRCGFSDPRLPATVNDPELGLQLMRSMRVVPVMPLLRKADFPGR